jgi:hypothetical protein
MSDCVDYYYLVLVLFSKQYQHKIKKICRDRHIAYQLEGTVQKQNNNNPHRMTYYILTRENSTKTK